MKKKGILTGENQFCKGKTQTHGNQWTLEVTRIWREMHIPYF